MNKESMKQIIDAKQQVKLMARQHGRASQQYSDAVKLQASLVLKQMKG